MTTIDTTVTTAPPLLKGGEHLTRDEFERRYTAMPHLKKAELIEGVVMMPSPVRDTHAEPHGRIMAWLGIYRYATPGVYLLDNATVRLDHENEPQPDALLRIAPDVGGRSRIGSDGYVEGAPELVVEIGVSSVDYDMRQKLAVYRRNGVQEYIVWEVTSSRLHWFRLYEGAYVPLLPDDDGVIRSQVFPGLWLTVEPFLHDERPAVVAALQQGIATPEHAALVARLRGE